MSFLRINWLAVDTQIDGFGLSDVSVDTYGRTASDSLEGLTYSVKKQYEFETLPLTLDDAFALEGWCRGLGHQWTFDRISSSTTAFTRYSDDSGLILSAGTLSNDPLYGTYAMELFSGATTTATAHFGSEGDWTIHALHSDGSGYVSYVTRSQGGILSSFEAGASATTVRFLGLSSASGYLGVNFLGRDSAGVNASVQFALIQIVPYAFTDEMILSTASPTFGMPSHGPARPPFVTVCGDALQRGAPSANEAGERGGIACKAYVESSDVYPVYIDGVFEYNARTLRVRLIEK